MADDGINIDETYSLAQAARLVGVTESAVRKAVRAGRLSATRDHAGRLRVAGSDLVAWAPVKRRAVLLGGEPWTLAEMARAKAVAESTVSRALQMGRLPARQVGEAWIVEEDAFKAWRPGRR